ncbi:hypothetical protein ACRRTK_020784 [Alexandromys fortis]
MPAVLLREAAHRMLRVAIGNSMSDHLPGWSLSGRASGLSKQKENKPLLIEDFKSLEASDPILGFSDERHGKEFRNKMGREKSLLTQINIPLYGNRWEPGACHPGQCVGQCLEVVSQIHGHKPEHRFSSRVITEKCKEHRFWCTVRHKIICSAIHMTAQLHTGYTLSLKKCLTELHKSEMLEKEQFASLSCVTIEAIGSPQQFQGNFISSWDSRNRVELFFSVLGKHRQCWASTIEEI